MRYRCVCLSLLWLLAVVSMTACGQQDQETLEIQIRKLQHELHTYALLQQLSLQPQQLSRLLQVCLEMQRENAVYVQKVKAHQAEFAKVLVLFRAEVAANKGLSKEVEGEAGRLSHQEKEMKKDFCRMVNSHEEKAIAILTPAQRIILDNYTPQLSYDPRRRKEDICEFLRQARGMDDEKFRDQQDRLVKQYMNRLQQEVRKHSKKQLPLPDETKVRQILLRVRAMSDSEFQQNLDELCEQLLPVNPVRQAKKELQQIHDEVYGNIGNAGKFLLSPCAIPYYQKMLNGGK